LPDCPFPRAFSVVDVQQPANPMHEPVVLPGGYVFVPLGLLLTAQDEAEFAGVLTQAMVRNPLWNVVRNNGTIPLFFMAGFPTIVAVSPRNQQVRIELQADATAAVAMSRAGIDPAALLRYIEREQRPNPFSQVPPREVRIDALRKTIGDLPPRAEYIEDSSDFSAVQKEAHGEGPEPSPPRLMKRH
jgi:predicted Zn-dependent protease